jgi:cytoskeletal protein RodZ
MGSTVGRTIRAARERRRLSVEEVAGVTKINPFYLRAMERDDFHLVPAGIYLKGYLRSVGRLLELDAGELYSGLSGSGWEPEPPLAA